MKKIFKLFLGCFLLVCAFMLFNECNALAKVSGNEVFEIEVGDERLPLYYTLEKDNNTVKERIQFAVILKGVSSQGKSYRWEHSLCFKIEINHWREETNSRGMLPFS